VIEIILVIAFLITIAILWRPVGRAVAAALDGRARSIRQNLDEAQRLHEEAKALVARYQRQLHEGEGLAKEILERAEAERRRLEAKLRADMVEMTERRTRQALDRIAQEEARTLSEVRARAADLAVRGTRLVLTERLEGDEAQRVTRNAIDEVGRRLAS
jgi:F-type H+-transporting ATPase subunit b